ncbi:MAG: 50S ribosomal protein L5 [Candidatus Omnitrophota bacterium]|nr:50S ribosomal protein L5 [Candidatus Omnitrophota bacterium]MDZ4242912.1 50S ribosomal protein L5 [Candidatus Omnitrophota bacterium]
MVPRLMKKYQEEVVPQLQQKFGIKNAMALPRLEKIVVNMGVGEALQDIKIMESAVQELTMITGQKPVVRRARVAISNFKLRENAPVGCCVTLRRTRMYEFLDKLVNISLPRIRDFNGVSRKSFDKQGNYTLGISDQSIFPEIDTGRLGRTQGMDISIVFDKGPKDRTCEVLRLLGMPFTKS